MTVWPRAESARDGRLPIGIIGDSDSQSYLQKGCKSREPMIGGAFHASTLQWTDALVKMRGDQVDLGEFRTWGVPNWFSMTRIRDGLGLRWRGPRKEDYRYNFAWPCGCAELLGGGWRQVPRLLDVMEEDPERWHRGVVIIRIGINDVGKEDLDSLSVDPDAPVVRRKMIHCVGEIGRAVALIRGRHPATRIVLVGIFDNSNWAVSLDKYRSASAISNISQGLDYFDGCLRSMCASDLNMAFFDDRAFFADHWGTRDSEGMPDYKTVSVGTHLRVKNTAGDHPENAVLANGHAGSVLNILWVRELVNLMRSSFDTPVDPLSDSDIVKFVDGLMPGLEISSSNDAMRSF